MQLCIHMYIHMLYLYSLMSIYNNVVLWISEDFSRHYFVMNKRLILYISDFKNFCYRTHRFFNIFSWTIINPNLTTTYYPVNPPHQIRSQIRGEKPNSSWGSPTARWATSEDFKMDMSWSICPQRIGQQMLVFRFLTVRKFGWVVSETTNGPMLLDYPLTSFTF